MRRIYGLDLLKSICAFMVICIHKSFPGLFGQVFVSLSRISVPIFFIITGYYYSHTKKCHKEKKQIMKILKLLVSANFLYFLGAFFETCIKNGSITEFLNNVCTFESILNFILFNKSPFAGHLWYLGAILYVLLIIFIFEKKWNRQYLYYIVPVLILINIVFGKYSLLLIGKSIPIILIRNFLFVGLPYFLIGDIIYTYNIKSKFKHASLLSLFFAFTTLIEHFLLGCFNISSTGDYYISTTFLAIYVFLLAVQVDSKPNYKFYDILCYIGEKYSTSIYILHPIFITIMAYISSSYTNFKVVYRYLSPIIIMLITIFASWLYNIAVSKIRLVCIQNKYLH